MNVYERESREIMRIKVRKGRAIINENVQFAILGVNKRPEVANWVPAIITDTGETGVMVENLQSGVYAVWVKVTDVQERPVWRTGLIRIS